MRAQIVGTCSCVGSSGGKGIFGKTMLLDCIGNLDSRQISQLGKQGVFLGQGCGTWVCEDDLVQREGPCSTTGSWWGQRSSLILGSLMPLSPLLALKELGSRGHAAEFT